MDWDSPTTKKHIAEAKAQGCELLGEGKDCNYRRYRLPCAHEQEIGTGKMRQGDFGCKGCVNDKLIAEAETEGCVLLGAGDNNRSRMYQLECGHKQSIETRNMRNGQFHCRTCLNDKLSAEAEVQGCEFIGSGKTKDYRTYRLPCGHEQEVQPTSMRINKFRCQTCLNNNLEEEAKAEGCVLLGEGSNCHSRMYRLPCGHEQEIETGNMRRGEGNFQCRACLNNKLNTEAKAYGCVLLGAGRNANYRTYRLECGHEREITLSSMRVGNFLCQTCEDTFYTLPSQAYLLHIKVGADEWLKLGYAKDIDFRISQYRLPSEADVTTLATLPFDTGKEAQMFEQSLHKKYKRKRLRPKDMKDFHAGSGFTECYPVLMVEKLMAEFRSQK
ncbi:GIY-YIG nuclease family protein [Pseudomonadota bacterium]